MKPEDDKLTVLEGFQAMYAYLEAHYSRVKADEIASVLSDMSTLEDGSTADPAAWKDWLDAVKLAKQGVDTRLKFVD